MDGGHLIAFKDLDLHGGTLLVSVPSVGVGGSLLTDHILENAGMDHLAGFDAPGMAPLAMIHGGKARFPVRIHADPSTRVAVMRSEVGLAAQTMQDLAREVMRWAAEAKLERIVILDAAWAADHGDDAQHVSFVTDDEALDQTARNAGLEPFPAGVLAGVTARLLLEGRTGRVPAIGLVAAIHDAESDVESAMRFAKLLPQFIPAAKIDQAAFERSVEDIEQAVLRLHEQVEQAMAGLGAQQAAGQDPFGSMV